MENRFWSHVEKTNDCWIWKASKNPNGYGQFCMTLHKPKLAHRIAWEFFHGAIPEGQVIRHKCRGKCVNPDHMELGTQLENNKDKLRDGTNVKPKGIPNLKNRGTVSGRSKLTGEQVIQIRNRAYKELHKDLAKEFGVSRTLISAIIVGRRWSYLSAPLSS